MTDKSVRIPRDRQFGRYLSLIPYSGSVKDVSLKGLKYPLDHEELGGFNARGVSNEIVEEEAELNAVAKVFSELIGDEASLEF